MRLRSAARARLRPMHRCRRVGHRRGQSGSLLHAAHVSSTSSRPIDPWQHNIHAVGAAGQLRRAESGAVRNGGAPTALTRPKRYHTPRHHHPSYPCTPSRGAAVPTTCHCRGNGQPFQSAVRSTENRSRCHSHPPGQTVRRMAQRSQSRWTAHAVCLRFPRQYFEEYGCSVTVVVRKVIESDR